MLAGGILIFGGRAEAQTTARLQPAKVVGKASAVLARKTVAPVVKASDALHLAYALQPGDSTRYKVLAIFTGHFPPFAQPDSAPINLKAQLTYVMTVKKSGAAGTEVAFEVDAADISLLEKEPGPDGKTDPESETPFPLPLAQVQKALNVTATLRPDGSVAGVTGGDTNPVKIDIGFDLRKLFLLMLPVTFPDRALKIGDSWNFDDGVLGRKPGQTTYTASLLTIQPEPKSAALGVREIAESRIDDRRDKDGKTTDKPDAVVDSTTGTVSLTGALKFAAPASARVVGEPGRTHARLAEGTLTMTALLDRKRTVADPEHPDDPLASKIDVKARLFLRAENTTHRPIVLPAVAPAAPKK